MRSLAAASRRGGRLPVAATAQRRHNSFIKQVMDQVQKDMAADPKLKQDWDRAQAASKKMADRGASFESRLSDMGESLKSTSARTSEILGRWKDGAAGRAAAASDSFNTTMEGTESLRAARDFTRMHAAAAAERSEAVLGRAKGAFAGIMDSSSRVLGFIGDTDKKAEKTKAWKETRHAMNAREEARDEARAAAAEASGEAGDAARETAKAPEPETALVVSEARSSTWDRFGTGLRDMPFLSSVFDNPVFDQLFGESEIAASIREMKEVDYSFRLEEFAEDMEYVVAPHIIKTYLEGDDAALEKHCGEAAFAAVNASIKARKQQKLTLDPAILAGPEELQLVSAKLNDKGPPSFIWTFNMQQINCLRDADGEIVEGDVDDIRTVCYAIAVNQHPSIEKDLKLEYPWQVSELAILWNQPSL